MNAPRKNSAVKKYESLITNGGSIEDLKLALASDEKSYTPAEIEEIAAAITNPGDGDALPKVVAAPKEKPVTEKPKVAKVEKQMPIAEGSLNRDYEEWKVSPLYKDIVDEFDNVKGRKLTGFEKVGAKPIKTTRVTEERANLLNSQSENTLLRLFEVGV